MKRDEYKQFRVIVVTFLLMTTGLVLDIKLGFAHNPFIPLTLAVDAQTGDPQQDPQVDTGNVGQTDGKIVTQKEPNSTQDPNSPSFKRQTTPPPAPQTKFVSTQSTPPTTTVVAGAQDVKTNPQGEVGGVDAVNQLFKGEDIGKQADSEPASSLRSWLWLLLVLPAAFITWLLWFILRKHSKEDEQDTES